MQTFDEALMALGRCYADAVKVAGGRSLARVATVVLNQGGFFDRLERGGTCTARNLERVTEYFREPSNWPNNSIPDAALLALAQIGRPALTA